MRRRYRLNFDTLIIRYNGAIRKLQRLQDLVTHGRTRTDRGIGDSRRLDYASRNTSCLYLPLRKGNKLQLSSLLMKNSDKSHIFRLASEITGREGGRPVTDKGTIKNLPKPIKSK